MYKPWDIGWGTGWDQSSAGWRWVPGTGAAFVYLSALDWLGPRGGYESGVRLLSSWRDGLEESLRMQTEADSLCSDCASKVLRNLEEHFSAQQPWDLISSNLRSREVWESQDGMPVL